MTKRQLDVLRCIVKAVNERGYPPSVREIQKQLGLRSPATVQSHLQALAAEGWVQRIPGHARALRVSDQARELLKNA